MLCRLRFIEEVILSEGIFTTRRDDTSTHKPLARAGGRHQAGPTSDRVNVNSQSSHRYSPMPVFRTGRARPQDGQVMSTTSVTINRWSADDLSVPAPAGP